jgi:hypothetical protein
MRTSIGRARMPDILCDQHAPKEGYVLGAITKLRKAIRWMLLLMLIRLLPQRYRRIRSAAAHTLRQGGRECPGLSRDDQLQQQPQSLPCNDWEINPEHLRGDDTGVHDPKVFDRFKAILHGMEGRDVLSNRLGDEGDWIVDRYCLTPIFLRHIQKAASNFAAAWDYHTLRKESSKSPSML